MSYMTRGLGSTTYMTRGLGVSAILVRFVKRLIGELTRQTATGADLSIAATGETSSIDIFGRVESPSFVGHLGGEQIDAGLYRASLLGSTAISRLFGGIPVISLVGRDGRPTIIGEE